MGWGRGEDEIEKKKKQINGATRVMQVLEPWLRLVPGKSIHVHVHPTCIYVYIIDMVCYNAQCHSKGN